MMADIFARAAAERWHVEVEPVGGSVHVKPVIGLREPMYGGSYKRTYRGIARAVRKWQRWCDRQNRKIDKAQTLAGLGWQLKGGMGMAIDVDEGVG